MLEFITQNMSAVVSVSLTALWAIAKLTPTSWDNDVLSLLTRVMNVLVPNRKKGGGRHR